ncbi:thiamine/thiamine pyrophosphate ABC transporter permease ThiP [Vibrio sonorensis]|uniref:thiamine/thiamine pyrophosphate ABC transporter permease ThiP n=1 Tax=Vibrio sonorensis TaxID=1004316 RepID=UPI0008D97DD7|nr:thiamine/thiamine pyrophosphate ABC transporter permease ThiP [Vibrio sonorensis]
MVLNKAPKAGIWVASIIAAFIISALASLIWVSPNMDLGAIWRDPYYRHVTQFSFYQSLLSTILSVGLAVPVSLALSRRVFKGKTLLLKLFSTTLVLPVLVGVFGLLAIYGNSGLLSQWLKSIGGEMPFSIYGLSGILLAHVFFNLPYASRLLWQALESIPAEQHKLSAHLGMSDWQKFKIVEWPRIRQQIPHISSLVFMLCFTSFATVMALGGGPKATTIELAIYQAIKFDFDLQTGAVLAVWQMLLCCTMAVLFHKLAKPVPVSKSTSVGRWSSQWVSKTSLVWDYTWIVLALLLVIPPLVTVVLSGLNPKVWLVLSDSKFWQALGASLKVAGLAALFSLTAGYLILTTSRHWRLRERTNRADGIEVVGTIILVTPGLVVSTGLFLFLRHFADVYSLAFVVVVAVNTLMGLPYVLKTLAQPMLYIEQEYQYLCASLGIRGWHRFRLIEWRALNRPIAHAFAISFLVAIGDLSAIALFGSQEFRTLPLYLFQLLGSYQMEAAAFVSLTLLILSMSCFVLIERLFKRQGK